MPQKHNGTTEKGKRPLQGKQSAKGTAAKLLGRIGIVLLILIPTYFAIIGYLVVKNRPEEIIDTYYTSMEISGPGGSHFTATPSSELFESFRKMIVDSVYTTGIPDTHITGKYAVVMQTNTGAEHYTFHFSITDGAAYYINAGGTIYRTADGRAESFLNSTYAYELYPQSAPPVLTTAVTDKVTPTQLSWYYQTQNGTFAGLSQVAVTDKILTYPIANDISFGFSLEPTSCVLTIKYGDTEQTYSSVNNISLPTLTQGTVLDIHIEANFAEDSRNNYYGLAVYNFRMTVVEAASFSLDATSKHFGDYFLLTCHNVKNETELVISASPALQNAPLIFKRGEVVYAAIPADAVCSDPQSPRQLTVVYGSVSDTFRLTIHPTDNTKEVTFVGAVLHGDWQGALNSLLTDKLRDKGAGSESSMTSKFALGESFASPIEDGEQLIAFGDKLTVSGTSLENKTALFEYYRTDGAVLAMAGGYVVETGYDELLGNYVILDHGGGIYTWYCGLGSIEVTPSYVRTGERLGMAGQTGFGMAEKAGVTVLATCGKTVISPQYLRQHTVNASD